MDDEAKADMEQLLSELQQLLVGVSIMQDLTCRAKDSLVSFGERLSTRLFAAFLRQEVRCFPERYVCLSWGAVLLPLQSCFAVF